MKKIINLGKKIYNMKNTREQRRFVVFVGRVFFHRQSMQRFIDFFKETEMKAALAEKNPLFYEQVTRQFFYKDSTFRERQQLIEENIEFLVDHFSEECLKKLYIEKRSIELWSNEYENQKLSVEVFFYPGQKKEGTLSIVLNWGPVQLYQMIFWIAKDKMKNTALYIGAMQGPSVEDANKIIKELTKQFFGYRTKNLILYVTRAFARGIGVEKIYGVTNDGYYANNHLRADRKLKTSFTDFWQEAGGIIGNDPRFCELSLTENRKTMDEIKTHKRNQYRKRFAVLDEIDNCIMASIVKLIRK